MRKLGVVLAFLFSVCAGSVFAEEPQTPPHVLTLSQKIALTLYENHTFPDNQILFYRGYDMYHVEYVYSQVGSTGWVLVIDIYRTNVDFGLIKKSADIIAHDLMYGPPRIFKEIHFVERNFDDQFDSYQAFFPNEDSSIGFTRAERDRGDNVPRQVVIKDGIKNDSEVMGSIPATPEERKKIQRIYEESLVLTLTALH